MSATSQPTDFSDLYTDLQNRVRVTTGVTATENQAKRYINIGLHEMHIGFGEKFPWAEGNAILRTQAQYTTGTVSVSKGGTTVTGSGTAWNTNNDFSVANVRAGGKITFGGFEVYEVSAVASDTSLTITTAFIDSAVSAGSYTYFEDEYALDSNFLRPIDLQTFSDAMAIDLIDRTLFRRQFPRNNLTGAPKVATILDKPFDGDTTPVRKVRLWKPPDTNYLIPYAFVTNKLVVQADGTRTTSLVDDDDEPIVPLNYRTAIVLHGLWHWYRDKKDDGRSKEVATEWADLMKRIVGDVEIGGARPQLQPRLGSYVGNARAPWRGVGGARGHTTGTSFDQLRS